MKKLSFLDRAAMLIIALLCIIALLLSNRWELQILFGAVGITALIASMFQQDKIDDDNDL
jgi:hypothetical protein